MCKLCNSIYLEETVGSLSYSELPETFLEVVKGKFRLCTEYDDEEYTVLLIKYCPECGANLKEKTNYV